MLVTNQRNYEITASRGFAVQGVDSHNRRKAVRMAPEDRLIYYLSDRRSFAAAATVASGHFEEHTRIWEHYRSREDFPHRVRIRPDFVLDEGSWIDARQVGPTLEYVKKWAPEDWPLAFVGMLHIIPQRDFNFLEDEIKRLVQKSGREPVPAAVAVAAPPLVNNPPPPPPLSTSIQQQPISAVLERPTMIVEGGMEQGRPEHDGEDGSPEL